MQLLLFCGVQASGKSSYYKAHFADTHIRLEYSPESFSTTEIEYAVEICEAVKEEWAKTTSDKIILNLQL